MKKKGHRDAVRQSQAQTPANGTAEYPQGAEDESARRERVYLAGPMRGYPEYNFPAFWAASMLLRARGYDVFSPAERDITDDGFNPATGEALPLRHYMRFDLPAVLDSDAVVVLPGWDQSEGAKLEVIVAVTCGIPVRVYPTLAYLDMRLTSRPFSEPPGSILDDAARLTSEDRHAVYGHPADDFARTASMWSALFGIPVTAMDVSMAMICVKLSRLRQTPGHRDSLVDIAGYARCAQLVDERSDS